MRNKEVLHKGVYENVMFSIWSAERTLYVESDSSWKERPSWSLLPTSWMQEPATEGAAQC